MPRDNSVDVRSYYDLTSDPLARVPVPGSRGHPGIPSTWGLACAGV